MDKKRSRTVANTKNSSGEQTEWERGESVGGGGVDSIWSEDKRNDLERAADVANSKRRPRETQLQWEQRVLREQNREGQTERPSGGDVSERGIGETFASFRGIFDGISDWLDEPRHIQRTTHKNEYRADRLKQLGNALLPQITYRIGLAIKEIEEKE